MTAGANQGDITARNLEERLQLEPGSFDSMNAATVEWAVKFDALPPKLKARWVELVAADNRLQRQRGSRG